MKRTRILSVLLSLCMIVMCMAGMSVTASALNYTITIADGIQNGGVAVQDEAAEGETVDIDVTPDTDYLLDIITVTDTENNDIEVSYPSDDDEPYTFTMPASDVTVNAIFTEKPADIDISAATVTVDTSAKEVTVIIDGEEVPDYDYHIIYYTYEGTETGESLVRAGTKFPQTTGTYIAVAVANDDSGYTGSVRSEPFTFTATGDIDISDALVFVDTSTKTVKVMVDGVVVSEDDYHIIFFTYEKTEGGESVVRAGTNFPQTTGTYIATVTANEDSGYTGSVRSEPFTFTATGDIDISNATVFVDTSAKTVKVMVDGVVVSEDDYHIIFYTYEKTESGESLTRTGTEFPTAPGTYIVAVIANEDSGYNGETRSEPFTVAESLHDISDAIVYVTVESQNVTVRLDGGLVPSDAYHVIYFIYAKTEGGESLTRVGTDFPTEPGTYITAIVANQGSGYTGETRSEPFTVAPAYTPINVPTYTPSSVTTDTSTESSVDTKEEAVSEATVENTTDTEENFGGADIDTDPADLEQAVLTDADRQAIKDGRSVDVYLEVKEVEPTADERELIEAAAEDIGEDITIAVYLDLNLFKRVGSSSAVQINETNNQIEISFALPEGLENDDPTVERSYYIARIHDGEVDIIPAAYDPETGKLSFLTDRFSTYAIIFVDVALEDDSELSNGEEEVPDLSDSIVYVTVESQNVTVRLHGGLVSEENYHVIFFAYEKIEGGESLTRVGTDFPTEPGTYIAAIVANEGSVFFGENRSEPFTIEATEAAAETNPGTGTELPGLAVLTISAAAVSFTAKRKLK